MLTFFLIVLALLLALHVYREYWRLRPLPQIHRGEFSGEIFKVGTTYIARKPASNGCSRSIVCFPGFLEDMRYFLDVYKDDDAELILLNNANYHCPFPVEEGREVIKLDWPKNPYAIGSIEHDGFYLGLAIERLTGGDDVCVHGHSRGGAVVLEAGRQRPELMAATLRPVSALLEAPVLPQARTPGKTSEPLPHRIACYFLPIFFGLKRNISADKLLELPMMQPSNALKTQLCLSIFSVSRSYDTCIKNVQSIVAWQRAMGFDVYDNYPVLTVLIGERDDSLNRPSMLASAEQGQARNSGLSIVETVATNHFISLEAPDTVRAVFSGN